MKSQAAILSLLVVANALVVKRQDTCTDPVVRKEWRSLSDDEKTSYLDAVLCLKNTTSRLESGLSNSLFDDFGYVHNQLDTSIHFVAVFLPWHRWYVQLYEEALSTCGYNGTATYWDWTQDYEDPFSSAIFDTELGFGGDGGDDGCVATGPFANLQVSTPDSHCLTRAFNASTITEYNSPDVASDVLATNGYSLYRPSLENTMHRGPHGGVGGDMVNIYSPNDPIFFLHHGNIDRVWWQWQNEDSTGARRTEYSGNRYQDDAATEATLSDEVPMFDGFVDESLTVSDIIWVQSGRFCYTYES